MQVVLVDDDNIVICESIQYPIFQDARLIPHDSSLHS